MDFGCLYALVAQAERGGVTVLLNENSMRLNANAVSIQGKERFLGDKASAIAKSNYKNTVRARRRRPQGGWGGLSALCGPLARASVFLTSFPTCRRAT